MAWAARFQARDGAVPIARRSLHQLSRHHLSRRRHPHHKARQRGGLQHEEAVSHGKEHRREVSQGNPRIPEARGHRGPGGGLGTRLGQHRLYRHGRRGLVFVDAATKCGGYDMPQEKPDQERFERIAAAYLAEAWVEDLTSIRYDIVSLLVTNSEKVPHATTGMSSTTGCDPNAAAPGLRARAGRDSLCACNSE